MDVPPPPKPPTFVYAATDQRPRSAEESRLCEKASSFDWLYFSMPVALDVAAIAFDTQYVKTEPRPAGMYFLGAGGVGFAWGWTLSGGYLALPKCSPDWVGGPPAEGDVRATWHLSVAIGLIAAFTAPIVVGMATGPIPAWWTDGDRAGRVVSAGAGAVLGSIFPYVLPPRTWSAARELQHLRTVTTADGRGGMLMYSTTF